MGRALISGPRGLWLHALVPHTRRERARGLLDRSAMARDEALLLMRARSVHTFGMGFAIKVALLNVDYLVRDVLLVQPGRVVLPRPTTRHVLELRADVDVRAGDRLTVCPCDRAGGPWRLAILHAAAPRPGAGVQMGRAPIV